MRNRLFLVAALLTCSSLSAQQLPNPTIIGSAPASSGFEATFALDGNLNTDYASNAQGTNTFIDFDFGAPTLIARVDWTDRRTSGGANGTAVLGPNDNVTQFNLIFSQNNIFGDGDDVVQSVSSPACCDTQNILINGGAGITAQFVRYDVTAIAGSATNDGAAEFAFFGPASVPALSPKALVLLALLVAAAASFALRR